eukprot:TRINITY_DN14868_c0_g1_i1.p1 TRINITY_DN14868_c0_g1~~TRINITY_DN14868_c0_g1_i1.p1  ORF type:complete len:202 (-),score=29.29 TRINITY_DN14868_c0_g1_i1:275-880(-)
MASVIRATRRVTLTTRCARESHHGKAANPPPHVLAEKLRAQGKKVPGFLLRPHEAGHIPPHQALSSLANTLRSLNPNSPTLSLVSADPWGAVHPAYPPHHEKHQPPHLLAMQMQREIDLGTGETISSESVSTPGSESVIRQLQHTVTQLQKENTAVIDVLEHRVQVMERKHSRMVKRLNSRVEELELDNNRLRVLLRSGDP